VGVALGFGMAVRSGVAVRVRVAVAAEEEPPALLTVGVRVGELGRVAVAVTDAAAVAGNSLAVGFRRAPSLQPAITAAAISSNRQPDIRFGNRLMLFLLPLALLHPQMTQISTEARKWYLSVFIRAIRGCPYP
jgi:hypothetical protein